QGCALGLDDGKILLDLAALDSAGRLRKAGRKPRLTLLELRTELRCPISGGEQVGLADAAGACEQYTGQHQGCYACHDSAPTAATDRWRQTIARSLRAGWGAAERYRPPRPRRAGRRLRTGNGARHEQL